MYFIKLHFTKNPYEKESVTLIIPLVNSDAIQNQFFLPSDWFPVLAIQITRNSYFG